MSARTGGPDLTQRRLGCPAPCAFCKGRVNEAVQTAGFFRVIRITSQSSMRTRPTSPITAARDVMQFASSVVSPQTFGISLCYEQSQALNGTVDPPAPCKKRKERGTRQQSAGFEVGCYGCATSGSRLSLDSGDLSCYLKVNIGCTLRYIDHR